MNISHRLGGLMIQFKIAFNNWKKPWKLNLNLSKINMYKWNWAKSIGIGKPNSNA